MQTDRFEKQRLATRQSIQQTFIKMLQTRDFDSITVREIAEEAGIGFKTFYRHYPDKAALTQAIMAGFVEDISKVISPPSTLEVAVANLRIILNYVQDNARAVRAIGQMPNREDLAKPIIQFALAEGVKIQSEGDNSFDSNTSHNKLISHHFVHSQLGLFFWWVMNDLDPPVDNMVELMSQLIIKPIWEL